MTHVNLLYTRVEFETRARGMLFAELSRNDQATDFKGIEATAIKKLRTLFLGEGDDRNIYVDRIITNDKTGQVSVSFTLSDSH